MGKKNKTPEAALTTVSKIAARKSPNKRRLHRAMRAYYKAAGKPVPEELAQYL